MEKIQTYGQVLQGKQNLIEEPERDELGSKVMESRWFTVVCGSILLISFSPPSLPLALFLQTPKFRISKVNNKGKLQYIHQTVCIIATTVQVTAI